MPVSTKASRTLSVSLKSHALRIGSFQGIPFEPIVFTVNGVQINMQGTVYKNVCLRPNVLSISLSACLSVCPINHIQGCYLGRVCFEKYSIFIPAHSPGHLLLWQK